MTEILEERLERVLIRYNVAPYMMMQRESVLPRHADRGDLSSDLADVARAYFDEVIVSKQGKAPQPELTCFEYGRAYRNKVGGGCLYVCGVFRADIENPRTESWVGLSPGGALVEMTYKTPAEWEQITLDEWREQWNDPAYVNMRGPSKRPSGDLDDVADEQTGDTIVVDDGSSEQVLSVAGGIMAPTSLISTVRDEQNYAWRSMLAHTPRLDVKIIGVGHRGRLVEALHDSDCVQAGGRYYADDKAWRCYVRIGRLPLIEPEDEASVEHGIFAGPGWDSELIERVTFDEPVNVSEPTKQDDVEAPSQLTIEQQALAHDDKGASEEMCTRCGWVMGHPPLNCQNDNSPHVFPSQLKQAQRTSS